MESIASSMMQIDSCIDLLEEWTLMSRRRPLCFEYHVTRRICVPCTAPWCPMQEPLSHRMCTCSPSNTSYYCDKIRFSSTANNSFLAGKGLNIKALAPAARNWASISLAESPQMQPVNPAARSSRTASVPNNCLSTVISKSDGKIGESPQNSTKFQSNDV